MLAEEHILVDISLSSISGATYPRNINEVYSASAFLFIFSYRAGRDTEYQHSRKPWPLYASLRQALISITTFLALTFFTKCDTLISEDKKIEDAALYLANNIDSNSLNLLKKYSFGKRGKLEFWQRISVDSFLYSFSLEQNGDTSQLALFRPFGFIKDFACNYQFDTSLYYEFHFSKL